MDVCRMSTWEIVHGRADIPSVGLSPENRRPRLWFGRCSSFLALTSAAELIVEVPIASSRDLEHRLCGGSRRFPGTTTGFHDRLPGTCRELQDPSGVSRNLQGFPRGFPGGPQGRKAPPKTSRDLQRPPETSRDFQGLPRSSIDIQVHASRIHNMLGVPGPSNVVSSRGGLTLSNPGSTETGQNACPARGGRPQHRPPRASCGIAGQISKVLARVVSWRFGRSGRDRLPNCCRARQILDGHRQMLGEFGQSARCTSTLGLLEAGQKLKRSSSQVRDLQASASHPGSPGPRTSQLQGARTPAPASASACGAADGGADSCGAAQAPVASRGGDASEARCRRSPEAGPATIRLAWTCALRAMGWDRSEGWPGRPIVRPAGRSVIQSLGQAGGRSATRSLDRSVACGVQSYRIVRHLRTAGES